MLIRSKQRKSSNAAYNESVLMDCVTRVCYKDVLVGCVDSVC